MTDHTRHELPVGDHLQLDTGLHGLSIGLQERDLLEHEVHEEKKKVAKSMHSDAQTNLVSQLGYLVEGVLEDGFELGTIISASTDASEEDSIRIHRRRVVAHDKTSFCQALSAVSL